LEEIPLVSFSENFLKSVEHGKAWQEVSGPITEEFGGGRCSGRRKNKGKSVLGWRERQGQLSDQMDFVLSSLSFVWGQRIREGKEKKGMKIFFLKEIKGKFYSI
jgi:hypothetical protein